MKLKIKNFGPLTKGGSIDLDKRFYVFVGKNGSGKTYVANLMYGLFQGVQNKIIFIINENFKQELKFNRKRELVIQDLELLPPEININELQDYIWKNKNNNSDLSLLFSYKRDFYELDFKFGLFHADENVLYVYSKEKNSNTIIWKEEQNLHLLSQLDYRVNLTTGKKEKLELEHLNNIFSNALLTRWLCKTVSTYNSIVFLPANRTSFLSLWRYIASTERKEKDLLFDINANRKLLSDSALRDFQPLYTRPVKDLINQLEYFDAQTSAPTNFYNDLLEELEELMGGKIKVHEAKEGIGRKRFTFEMAENGEEVELFLASSAVNQLSILYIYLKYWARERHNFLMIDEPEINLHPENQVKLVNILMKFADRNDNRVLINTHSTLLADAINNHIRIGHLQTTKEGRTWLENNQKWLNENQLDINEHIDYNDFGVYYFNGNAIKNYAVKDYGVFFKDFAEAEDNIQKTATTLKTEIHKELHAKKPQ